MPKGFVTQEQKQLDHIYKFIKGMSAVKGLTQTDIANALSIKQPTYSYKFRNKTLSLEDFVIIMNVLGRNVEDLITNFDEKEGET